MSIVQYIERRVQLSIESEAEDTLERLKKLKEISNTNLGLLNDLAEKLLQDV